MDSQFEIFVVQQAFRSGELGTAAIQQGEVLEIDRKNRLARYQGGSAKKVKSILSGIDNGWLRPASEQEKAYIRKHGVAPSRKYESPDLQKIMQERTKVMQDTIPEGARGQDEDGVESSQAITLDQARTKDQYKTPQGAKTAQDKGSEKAPPQPKNAALVDMTEDPTMAEAGVYVGEATDDEIAAAEEGAPSEEDLALIEKEAGERAKPPTYEGDFDYKKRISAERREQLETMDFGELTQLKNFLIYRDKSEQKDRKITGHVAEVWEKRKEEDSDEDDESETQAPPPADLSFNFDVTTAEPYVLHLANMTLEVEQVQELAEYYQSWKPRLAKKLAKIVKSRTVKSGGRKSNKNYNQDPELFNPSMTEEEASLVGKLGGQRLKTKPQQEKPKRGPNLNATPVADDQDLLATIEDRETTVPEMAGQDVMELSEQDHHVEGGTEVQMIQTGEAAVQRGVGSEEGIVQALNLRGPGTKPDASLPGEGLGNDVVDLSDQLGDGKTSLD